MNKRRASYAVATQTYTFYALPAIDFISLSAAKLNSHKDNGGKYLI